METSREYFFTLTEPTSLEIEIIKGWRCKYLIFSMMHEVGEVPYLRGYVVFKRFWHNRLLNSGRRRMRFVAPRNGMSHRMAINYVKDGVDIYEKGVYPRGTRQNYANLCEHGLIHEWMWGLEPVDEADEVATEIDEA